MLFARRLYGTIALLNLYRSSAFAVFPHRTMSISQPPHGNKKTLLQVLKSPLTEHGRELPRASFSSFFLTVAFVPVWATTVLPLSVVYQLGKAATSPLRKALLPAKKEIVLDSGYVVEADTVTPRLERPYDIVVLGATGFTGYLAARHLAKTYGVNQSVKWTIAGRSSSKLKAVKQKLSDEIGLKDILELEPIIVDTSDPASMPLLVNRTRVLATTAGPYQRYGNSVVEFCAKFGTHYVDITGMYFCPERYLLSFLPLYSVLTTNNFSR